MLNVEVDLVGDLGACNNRQWRLPQFHGCWWNPPLVASVACAKKAKVMVRISSADSTIRWKEDMIAV